MKKSLLLLISIWSLCLLNGCGSGGASTTPPPPVATHFSVTAPLTATAGTPFNVTVTALDASNSMVSSYSGTVQFTSSDGQVVQPASATLTSGTGTFPVTLKTTGSPTITATAASITGTSSRITVSPVGATHFSVTPATTSSAAGTPFSFTVTALDASNNVFPSYSGMVNFTSTDNQAVFSANNTPLTNGTGTFQATLKTAGVGQTITATDTVAASITGFSSINVSAGAATRFLFTVSATTTTRAAVNFVVTAVDAFNNTATSYSGTVHFTSTDTQAVFPTNPAGLTNGSAGLPATFETVGSWTITATDTVTASLTGTSTTIVVSAAAALTISTTALPNGTVGFVYNPHPARVCVLWAPFPFRQCLQWGYRTAFGFTLTATGGVPGYTWSWAPALNSSLPPGLNLGSGGRAVGLITGTPTQVGTYKVVVTLNDSGTPPAPVTANFTITIAAPPLVITSSNLPDGNVGTAYSATLSTSDGTPPVTWSVTAGALPAGLSLNANTGAITGTPTTAALSNFTVQAVDSGTPQQTKTQTLSINVNPAAVNNGELNGQYVFSLQGFDASGPVDILGSFTADGAGNLTAGLRDVNRAPGVTASQAFIGTYQIYADNRGRLTLQTSPGGTDLGTYLFAVGSLNAGVASKGRLVEFDASGIRVAGVIEKQDPAAFSTANITGDYAFGVSSAISGTANFGAAGRFTATAGTISSGSVDEDNQGNLKSNATFTGTYSVAASGRGTLTLNVAGSANPVNADFYVVSAGELLLMSSDAQSVNPLFAGAILQQSGAGTFSNASLNSASVIRMNGLNSNGTADVVLGLFNIPSSGNFTLAADENNGGTVQALNQAGTYTVASNGRVTVTGATKPPVFYLVGANKGFVVGTDANATTGFFEPQTGGPLFATGSANGAFFFGASTPVNANVSDESGVLTFNGTGSVTGTTDSNKASGLFPNQAFTDTYMITASGRGTMTTSGTIFYLISPSKYVLMDGGIGASNSSITVGEK